MVAEPSSKTSKQAPSATTASVNGQITAPKAALHPTVTSRRCSQFRHTGSSQPIASTTPTTSHHQPNTQDPGKTSPTRGIKPGLSTSERGELAAARRRIQELETELALVKQAAKLFEEGCAQSQVPGHR